MTSTIINQYLDDNAKGGENDYEIECTRNQYGVIRIIVKSKHLRCDVPKCRVKMKRNLLKDKQWTDKQGLPRRAKMCPTCSAVANDLYGI